MPESEIEACLSSTADGVLIRIKVVPGAKREKLAGMLGDRLKLSVSAPPEGGKANKAVCQLLANICQMPVRDISVRDGLTQPRKTIEVRGQSLCSVYEHISHAFKSHLK